MIEWGFRVTLGLVPPLAIAMFAGQAVAAIVICAALMAVALAIGHTLEDEGD